VEVGDVQQPDTFYPQVKIMRWDNECNFSARLVHEEASPQVALVADKVQWVGDAVEAHFYEIGAGKEGGGFEFEIILKEPPKSNIISMTIQTKGLDFLYQPPLTIEEITRGAQRPENVVGSYAVYHQTMAGDFTALGGKNYLAGKAFHIFRPRIEDAVGNWVWGDLNIDEVAGLLTVTIPQDFLDKAVYPVHHAAGLTFGYTSQGASNLGMPGVHHFLGKANSTPASNGTLQSISAYLNGQTNNAEFDPALYSDVSGTATARLSYVNSGGTKPGTGGVQLVTTTMPSYSVTTGTQYWFGYKSNGVYADGLILYYDSGGVGMPYNASFSDWPDPWWSSGTDPAWKPSIWGTYIEAGIQFAGTAAMNTLC
jgi:hypothetical protein